MEAPLVDEGAGKGCLESRILSNYHNVLLFYGLAAASSYGLLNGGTMQM
jgi:hypothetical protein